MSSSCDIILPGNIRIKDVANVVGIAAGFKPYKKNISKDGWATYVDGVTIKTEHSPGLASFNFDGRFVLYHFESSDYPGCRLLNPSSTSFWSMIGHRLVDFFGGRVKYDDTTEDRFDYQVMPKQDSLNCPTGNNEWYVFQQRMLDVEPITIDDLKSIKGAAYDWEYDLAQGNYTFDSEGRMTRESPPKTKTAA